MPDTPDVLWNKLQDLAETNALVKIITNVKDPRMACWQGRVISATGNCLVLNTALLAKNKYRYVLIDREKIAAVAIVEDKKVLDDKYE